MKQKTNDVEKELSFLRKNLRWILFVICVMILIVIIKNIFEQEIQGFDQAVYSFVSHWASEPMTYFMKFLTVFASASVLCSICFVFLLVFQERRYGLYFTINLFIIAGLNIGLKNIFDRPRPEGYRLIQETGYSFPSGHSMASMAFYGLMIYFIWRKVQNPYWKWILCIGLFLLVLGIGISRIYLGVHYASDVVGGFCFSVAYLACYTQIVSNFLKKRKKEEIDGAN